MVNNYKVVATKINKETYLQFKCIADRIDLKIYNLLQIVIDSYIKLLSKDTFLTDELKQVVSNFAPIKETDKIFTLSEPFTNKIVCNKSIAIISKEGTSQQQAVLIKQEEGEKACFNRNSDTILIELLNTMDKTLVNNLKTIKRNEQLLSISEALRFSIMKASKTKHISIAEEIQSLFCDNERNDFGEKIDINEIGKYKRSMHKEMK